MRRFPLCDLGASIPSFEWVELHDDLDIPALATIEQLVRLVVTRLHMEVEELVVAVVCLEAFIRAEPALLKRFSLRPLFLSSCILALKVSRDQARAQCQKGPGPCGVPCQRGIGILVSAFSHRHPVTT